MECGSLNTFSVVPNISCSGMEFWLGGRGAARFFRAGATGGCVFPVKFMPVESSEFSEVVELYGDGFCNTLLP